VGNFYTNFALRGPTQDQIVEFLRAQQRTAYVTPTVSGITVVCDERCDEQDFAVIEEFGLKLSESLACALLAVLNHDDDVLFYWLFSHGVLEDDYNSAPSYFDDAAPSPPRGGDTKKLCEAFAAKENTDRVEAILRTDSLAEDGYVFAIQRHMELAHALQLPAFSVGVGFNYLEAGELPQGLRSTDLVRVAV